MQDYMDGRQRAAGAIQATGELSDAFSAPVILWRAADCDPRLVVSRSSSRAHWTDIVYHARSGDRPHGLYQSSQTE